MTSTAFPTAESMVNAERYPIDPPESEAGAALLKSCRQEFASAGLVRAARIHPA